jgi:hypothetical protein
MLHRISIPVKQRQRGGSWHWADPLRRLLGAMLRRQTYWSIFDQQVCQIPLLYMLVTRPTCPLNIPNGVYRHRTAFIGQRSKRGSGAGALANMLPDFPAAACR